MSATTSTRRRGFLSGLYTGTGAFDIVGKAKIWYIGFGLLMLVCLLSVIFRGFNLGIDFTGGSQIQFPAQTAAAPASVETVREVYERAVGREPDAVQAVGTGAAATIQIKAQAISPTELVALRQAVFDTFKPIGTNGQPDPRVISDTAVSGT